MKKFTTEPGAWMEDPILGSANVWSLGGGDENEEEEEKKKKKGKKWLKTNKQDASACCVSYLPHQSLLPVTSRINHRVNESNKILYWTQHGLKVAI